MKRYAPFILCILCAAFTFGCATSGGDADAERKAAFSKDKAGVATGKLTINREFDPVTGNITSEQTTMENLATFADADESKVRARGVFATQDVGDFEHKRNTFMGSRSESGVKSYKADPDAEALKVASDLLAEIVKKAIESAKGIETVPVPENPFE